MIETILGVVVLGAAAILQSAIISRLPLINGLADLEMLLLIAWVIQPHVRSAWIWVCLASFYVSLLSALTLGALPVAYLLIFLLSLIMRQRFWKARFLTMLALALLGTLIVQAISVFAIALQGTFFSLPTVFNLVTLPSMLLNIILAVPVYAFIRDLVNWLYPEKIEV